MHEVHVECQECEVRLDKFVPRVTIVTGEQICLSAPHSYKVHIIFLRLSVVYRYTSISNVDEVFQVSCVWYIYLKSLRSYNVIFIILNKTIQELFVACFFRVVRKPTFCICENKDADQLRGAKLISAFVFVT